MKRWSNFIDAVVAESAPTSMAATSALLLLFLLKLVLFLRLRVLLVLFVLSLFRCSFCPVFTLVVVSLK